MRKGLPRVWTAPLHGGSSTPHKRARGRKLIGHQLHLPLLPECRGKGSQLMFLTPFCLCQDGLDPSEACAKINFSSLNCSGQVLGHSNRMHIANGLLMFLDLFSRWCRNPCNKSLIFDYVSIILCFG